MNNTKVLFISSDWVKQNSPIMDNVENTLITSHIFEAQNIDLQNTVGEDLYIYFVNNLSGYTTGDSVETLLGVNYYELFDSYIKPYLMYKTIYYSFYDLYAKITAKGIVNQSSDYSITAEISLLEKRRTEYNNKGEHYRVSLLTYLNENSSDFSEFVSDLDYQDEDYSNSLYLGSEIGSGWDNKNIDCSEDYERF